ncbi:phosphatase PAP2 family protein [Nonomuraea sp. NPDC050643]|uniref:phosphatase PAP2 family protein n=1 Tax=Nonomuraea sp. NPDC050643 TaxID=3155660 RepID=UPI0033E7FCB4
MTDLFAPMWIVISLPLLVGGVTSGWDGAGWGLLAAGLCGGVPAVVIFGGVRRGWFGDWHIGERSQRPKLVAVIVTLVVLALTLLVVLGAPMVMVACVAIMLATLAVVGPITLAWKISFHTAVAAGSVMMLAWVLPRPLLVLAVGGVVVALIGWARVKIRDHTPAQVLAGTAAGAAATWATLVILL